MKWALAIQIQTKIPTTVKETKIFDKYRRILDKNKIPWEFDEAMDKEDFLERAAKLNAYYEECIRQKIKLYGHEQNNLEELTEGTSETEILFMDHMGYKKPTIKGQKIDEIKIENISEKKVDYQKSKVFEKYAMRKYELCRNTDDEDELTDEMKKYQSTKEALSKMGRDIVMKIVGGYGKEMPVAFIENTGDIPEDIYWYQYRNYHLQTMIQEKIEMNKEYRMIVVDGQLVAGAGVVPELTPEDNEEEFDDRIRKNKDYTYERDRAYVDKLKYMAQRIMEEFSKENLVGRNYTLDLFEGKNGEIGIVELNPLDLAGLYATSPTEIVKKTITRIKKRNMITNEEILTSPHP